MSVSNSQKITVLRKDLSIHKGGSRDDGSPTWMISDPIRNKFFNIGWEEYLVLKYLNYLIPTDIKVAVREAENVLLDENRIEEVIDFFQRNELLQCQSREHVIELSDKEASTPTGLLKRLFHQYIFFKVPLFSPIAFLSKTYPLVSFVYTRFFWSVVLCVFFIGVYGTSRHALEYQSIISSKLSYQYVHLFFLVLIVTKVIHELSHAYTAYRYGCRVPVMGVAFLFFFPVMYTDTSSSWIINNKKKRIAIAAAGIIAELTLAIIATALWFILPEGPLQDAMVVVSAITWVSTLLINLNPLMRFDGYYLLADWWGINNLQPRSFEFGRWFLREVLFQFRAPEPEHVSSRTRDKLITYAFICWCYRLVLYTSLAFLVYSFTFKALGILLMLLEIYYLILLPIIRECTFWVSSKEKAHLGFSNIAMLTVLFSIVFLLFYPFMDTLKVPALYSAKDNARIYLPMDAKIQAMNVKRGMSVDKGDVLVNLYSEALELELAITNKQLTLIDSQLSNPSGYGVEYKNILLDEREGLLSAQRGLLVEQSKLTVTAPINAVLEYVDNSMLEGRAIAKDTLLFELVGERNSRITAFVSESDLIKVKPESAVFIPQNNDFSNVDMNFLSSDLSAVTSIDDKLMLASYDGDIVVNTVNEKNVPQQAFYRWTYTSSSNEDLPMYEMKGTAVLATEPYSLMSRFINYVMAALVREMDF